MVTQSDSTSSCDRWISVSLSSVEAGVLFVSVVVSDPVSSSGVELTVIVDMSAESIIVSETDSERGADAESELRWFTDFDDVQLSHPAIASKSSAANVSVSDIGNVSFRAITERHSPRVNPLGQ